MLHVPTPVVAGDSILLKCEYELGNETLYAVKWYKNMGEFYRYVPASDPPLKTFPQVGIDVDDHAKTEKKGIVSNVHKSIHNIISKYKANLVENKTHS
ncbi:uncharacterized protein TNCT_236591 [Trichonephila clavata]|uniref:Ig-like domain-containing protein n=1 Tax=Trichonephila clavata TaxID=2740835 RepID=A0A8X6FR81_TRICU|nr:uncharacterized protein TNCT_236591 [Trichonephila clavata]